MGKLIKFIFKFILFLILFVLLLVAIILFILWDNKKTDFTPSEKELSAETIIAEGLDSSITRISALDLDTRGTNDNNYLGVALTVEDMNNIVVSMVRSQYNENYMKDGNTEGIVSMPGVVLESILFTEVDGKIAAKAVVKAVGFYRTSVTLSGTPKMNGNVVEIQFEKIKLGKLGIKATTVEKLMDKLNLSVGSSEQFDTKTMTLKFDVSSMISSFTSSNRFADFFTGCTYALDYTKADGDAQGNLALKIDTKKIFSAYKEVPTVSASYELALQPTDFDLITQEAEVDIAEKDFNCMINKEFKDAEFVDPITLGGKEFSFKLAKLYYNLDTNQVLAEMYINELKTNVIAAVTMESVKDSDDYVSEVVMKVSTLTLGETTVDAANFFSEVRIPASTLTNNQANVKVKEFTTDAATEQVKIVYKYVTA